MYNCFQSSFTGCVYVDFSLFTFLANLYTSFYFEKSAKLSRPPMGTSQKLAKQVLKYIKSNPHIFPEFNSPQLTAIEAALTRRMTMIHGPPGTFARSSHSDHVI